MNVLLPVILIIIANLVLYWIFFGNKKFEKKLEQSIQEKKAKGHQITLDEQQEIMQMTGSKVAGIFGNMGGKFSKDKLIIEKKQKTTKKSKNKKVKK